MCSVFAFGDFNIILTKNWLSYCSRTNRPSELYCNFSISNTLTQISDCDSPSPAPLQLFVSSEPSSCYILALPLLESFDVISVSTGFPSNIIEILPS